MQLFLTISPCVSKRQSSAFPDPVPNEVESVLHYHEGADPTKKILPSVLDDVEKSAQGIPFNPTSQTAKDVGFIVRCEEYQKPRLVHSKLKLKIEESQGAQRIMKELSYLYVGTRE